MNINNPVECFALFRSELNPMATEQWVVPLNRQGQLLSAFQMVPGQPKILDLILRHFPESLFLSIKTSPRSYQFDESDWTWFQLCYRTQDIYQVRWVDFLKISPDGYFCLSDYEDNWL